MGMLYHIFKNGWEDKQYIHDRVYGMDKVREEAAKWTPDKVEEVTGMKEAEVLRRGRDRWPRTVPAPSCGRWARPSTPTATPSCARRAFCSSRSATSASRAAAPTSTAATTTCRARPTSVPIPIRCPATTASRPVRGNTGARVWGVDYEWMKKQFASQAMMEKPGITVSRWIDAVLEKNENHRPGSEPACGGLLGPRAEQPEPRQGNDRGDEEARSAGRDRSVSVRDRGDGGDGAAGRRLPAAGGDAARVRGFGDCVQPFPAVARKGDRSDVRVAHRPHDHVPARPEVRLRQGVRGQDQARQGQGRHGRAGHGRHAARNQPRRPGPSATPASRRSGCRRTCATCTYST